jgi:SAM-dependent methyltransferase
MKQKQVKGEHRTLEQIREHYEIEKELANRLRHACKEERRYLYSSLYDELYRRVPLHPQLTRKTSPEETRQAVEAEMKFIRPFLAEDSTLMEVGPGDCALSLEVAKIVKQVYAVDVSDEITKALTTPDNFQLILSDGCSIPVPDNSVNVAYSNQLMEHLHPDDAFEQLRNIHQALVPGGIYLCFTPNRLNGPHDVSGYFDVIASGFHLREYTITELSRLFRRVGFSKVGVYVGAGEIYRRLPTVPLMLCEGLLDMLPFTLRDSIARSRPVRGLLSIRLVGTK